MTDYIKSMRSRIGSDRLLIVGAGVYVHKDGKLLLQKRKDNGYWANHGGCMELGESPEQTARRELFEETGLRAGALQLLGAYSGTEFYYTYPNGDKVCILDVSYLCEDFSGEVAPQESEVAELRWFPLDALPQSISPPVKPSYNACVALLRERQREIDMSKIEIAPIDPIFRERVNAHIESEWSGPIMISKGAAIDTRLTPGFVAVRENTLLGCVTYRITGTECEIVTLNSLHEGKGIGSALISAVIAQARNARCERVWLITTNDNTAAMRFYQRRGFSLAAVHFNALDASRALKPTIPKTGLDGIPLSHEFEFEMRVNPT